MCTWLPSASTSTTSRLSRPCSRRRLTLAPRLSSATPPASPRATPLLRRSLTARRQSTRATGPSTATTPFSGRAATTPSSSTPRRSAVTSSSSSHTRTASPPSCAATPTSPKSWMTASSSRSLSAPSTSTSSPETSSIPSSPPAPPPTLYASSTGPRLATPRSRQSLCGPTAKPGASRQPLRRVTTLSLTTCPSRRRSSSSSPHAGRGSSPQTRTVSGRSCRTPPSPSLTSRGSSSACLGWATRHTPSSAWPQRLLMCAWRSSAPHASSTAASAMTVPRTGTTLGGTTGPPSSGAPCRPPPSPSFARSPSPCMSSVCLRATPRPKTLLTRSLFPSAPSP
mmetsp:Transcript_30707/g.71754  ORF Transcript_30707/g.71754 Transcript_30707/m.71754 type:complete len:339 (-) Transcript_30707:1556-2572(-)